ncbi:MAG: hypothetical protein FJ271_07615 [Planctomycetes bacterium]|nr:hypothetical protein [Planctomycetota bacterium]
MMPPYPISCYTRGCKNLAAYKIAALWSDGQTQELKTYGLCCQDCLENWFRHSRRKQHDCRLTVNETLEPPGIYALERGERDQQLRRLEDLEKSLGESAPQELGLRNA